MSHYVVYIIPSAFEEIRDLPGHIKQRVKQEIKALAKEPRPPNSKQPNLPDFENELRRIRLDRWRILYSLSKTRKQSTYWL